MLVPKKKRPCRVTDDGKCSHLSSSARARPPDKINRASISNTSGEITQGGIQSSRGLRHGSPTIGTDKVECVGIKPGQAALSESLSMELRGGSKPDASVHEVYSKHKCLPEDAEARAPAP